MPLTPIDALRLADQAGQRSATLHRYEAASPHLILWGVIYAVAYTASFLRPAEANLIWTVATPAGILGNVLIARGCKPSADLGFALGAIAALLAFTCAAVAVMQPRDPQQIAAFVPLVVALVYVMFGLRHGLRFAATGIALGVLTCAGFFALRETFMLWMAVIGGGSLILAGLWLRRA